MSRHKEFFLILVDEEKKVFNVVGPMMDDAEWNRRIVALQDAGRRVRCCTAEAGRSREEVVELYARQTGYKYSGIPIVKTPVNESPSYQGELPAYARAADRRRVVKLLCKGGCRTTRWAAMNVDYPGQEVLRKSQVGDFSATCLKCGRVARDPYNWYR